MPIHEDQPRLRFGNREGNELRFFRDTRVRNRLEWNLVKRREVGKSPFFVARRWNGQFIGTLYRAHAQRAQPVAPRIRHRLAALQQAVQVVATMLYTHHAAALLLNSVATQS